MVDSTVHGGASTSCADGATRGFTSSAESAGALSNYGRLHASSSATLDRFATCDQASGCGFEPSVSANSLAQATEILNISGGAGQGFLSLTGQMFGSELVSDAVFASAVAALSINVNGSQEFSNCSADLGAGAAVSSGTSQCTVRISVNLAGDQVGLTYSLQTRVLVQTNGAPVTSSSNATSDFSHTANFGNLSFVDANGNPISGITVTSTSGFDYTQPTSEPSSVPEPSSLLLLGTGLLGGIGAVRRKFVR